MTDQQKKFLDLHIIEDMRYEDIVIRMNIPRATLTKWYDELKDERSKISEIKRIWGRKKIQTPFREFYNWYLSNERKCIYCGITEQDIQRLIDNGRLESKRLGTRGRKLELERKQPKPDYNDSENLAFACYWCNNAKTDSFSELEFKRVGKVFSEIWKERLSDLR